MKTPELRIYKQIVMLSLFISHPAHMLSIEYLITRQGHDINQCQEFPSEYHHG